MDSPTKTLRDTDSHAWLKQQVEALRALDRGERTPELDLQRLIEDLDAMATSEERRVESLARLIIEHLLLTMVSPAELPQRRWFDEIDEFRAQLETNLTPTLANHLRRQIDRPHRQARRYAIKKLRNHDENAAADRIASLPPFTYEQVVDPDFYPERLAEAD